MQIRQYSSTSVDTTLASAISTSDTTMTVASGGGSYLMGGITLTTGDTFAVALDPDTVNEEVIFITAQSGDNFTIVRGRANTSAVAHGIGATVRHVFSSDDLNWFNTTSPGTLTTAKGDIIVGTGVQAVDNLAAGTDGFILMADSTDDKGVKWVANTAANLNVVISAKTGATYTLVAGDVNKLITLSNSSAITLTIPSGIFTSGQQIHIQQLNTGQVTVVGASGVTYTGTGTKLRTRYSAATIICTGTNTFTMLGDII